MSVKLRGLLMDHYQSKLEQSYMREHPPVTLKNVDCEMVFQSESASIEHEDEAHHYLPVFHLRGRIKELKGNFPYSVSSISFGDDTSSDMTRDCYYYPTPAELAHMITVGKFYSNQFQIPEILNKNEYVLPVKVDLTVVPPTDEARYQAMISDEVSDDTVQDVDKSNLPLLYVKMLGTGVNEKTDKLLDYYGIHPVESFETYDLTAESSEYTDPPLMMYMEEPLVREDEEEDTDEDDFMMLKDDDFLKTEPEKAKEDDAEAQPVERFANMEDVIVARMDRNIERRVLKQKAALQPVVPINILQKEESSDYLEDDFEDEKDNVKDVSLEKDSEEKEYVTEEPVMEQHVLEEDISDDTTLVEDDDFIEDDILEEDTDEVDDMMVDSSAHVIKTSSDTDKAVDTLFAKPDVEEEDVTKQADDVLFTDETSDKSEKTHPDVSQKYLENTMTTGATDAVAVQQVVDAKEDALLDKVESKEDANLEDLNGKDVSDASLQTKVDEANTKAKAIDVAVNVHQEEVQKKGRRTVSDSILAVSEEYDRMQSASDNEFE